MTPVASFAFFFFFFFRGLHWCPSRHQAMASAPLDITRYCVPSRCVSAHLRFLVPSARPPFASDSRHSRPPPRRYGKAKVALNSWANWTGTESELEEATTLPLAVCEWVEEVDKLYAQMLRRRRNAKLRLTAAVVVVVIVCIGAASLVFRSKA